MRTKIWAHRGASEYAPENTLEAFSLAVSQGADGVELDVQLSADGEIVVIHDEWIDRVSDGSGWVRDYTLKELKSFRFQKTHPEYQDARIPTLREVYELLKPTDLEINVELKTGIMPYPGLTQKVWQLGREMDMNDRIWYSSFRHQSVLELKATAPEARTGFLYQDGYLGMPEYALKYGVMALHPALYLMQDEAAVRECRDRGICLHVWTVNEPEHIRMLASYGVEAVITNRPDVAVQVIGHL